jgi:uncharacterized protein (TIGR02271 family)
MADRDRKVDDARGADARNDVGGEPRRAADKGPGGQDPARTVEVVGEATGGVAGAAAGAAIGSLGGPIGTIIGGIAGALGGWWAGHAITEAASTFTDEDDRYYRNLHESRRAGGALRGDAADTAAPEPSAASATDYDNYRPAYQLGQLASRNPDYARRSFDDVEGDLRRGWTEDVRSRHGDWSDVRDYARAGFDRGREARLTLSEEQLAVGRRQVDAGEATIRKTVETEHVRETVQVQREEIVVERRPLAADAPTNVQIGEDEIRIPLTREEAVVEKRAVPVEEIVVRKEVVVEEQPVEADLRRERVDESSLRDATEPPRPSP